MNQTIDAKDKSPESMSIKTTILVIEDHAVMESILQSMGVVATGSSNLSDARLSLNEREYDAVVVDLGHSKFDPLEIIRHLRRSDSIPIITAYSAGQEWLRNDALFAGADDYITKPIKLNELQIVLRNAKRRKGLLFKLNDKSVFELGRLRLDKVRQRIFVNDKEIHLTPTEYKLLNVLAENAGRIVTHRQMLLEVWGKEYLDEVQYLRIYMGHLRKKLDEYSSENKLLVTEPRIGYRLAL